MLDYARNLNPERVGKVRKRLVEGDDVRVVDGSQGGLYFRVQGGEAGDIGVAVGGDGFGVAGQLRYQAVCQVGHHDDGIGDVQPDVGVHFVVVALMAVLLCGFRRCCFVVVMVVVMVMLHAAFQQGNAHRGVHHRQVGEGLEHAGKVAFHACAVDEEYIRPGQALHVARLQLVIMQAAGAGRGEAHDLHALQAVGEVEGEEINGKKGGDDGFRRGGAGQHHQQQRHQQGGQGDQLLHGSVLSSIWACQAMTPFSRRIRAMVCSSMSGRESP